MANKREQQYKLEMDNGDVQCLFSTTYILNAQIALSAIKEAVGKQDINLIKKLNKKFQHQLKELDKKVVNVQNKKFQILYAAHINLMIPYIQEMEGAAKAVDERKEYWAKFQAILSIPQIVGTIKGIEAILDQTIPIKK